MNKHFVMKTAAEIGAECRACRESKMIPVVELAKVVGVHPETVYRFERGEHFNRLVLAYYINVLGLDIDIMKRER